MNGKKWKGQTMKSKVNSKKMKKGGSGERADRVNDAQKRAMVDYLKEHTHFAQGRLKGANAAKKMKVMKQSMADKINKVSGTRRTAEKWWKCWISLKHYAKNYAASNYAPKSSKTGGGGPDDTVISVNSQDSFQDTEAKDIDFSDLTSGDDIVDDIMSILGWQSALGTGLPNELENDECEEVEEPEADKLLEEVGELEADKLLEEVGELEADSLVEELSGKGLKFQLGQSFLQPGSTSHTPVKHLTEDSASLIHSSMDEHFKNESPILAGSIGSPPLVSHNVNISTPITSTVRPRPPALDSLKKKLEDSINEDTLYGSNSFSQATEKPSRGVNLPEKDRVKSPPRCVIPFLETSGCKASEETPSPPSSQGMTSAEAINLTKALDNNTAALKAFQGYLESKEAQPASPPLPLFHGIDLQLLKSCFHTPVAEKTSERELSIAEFMSNRMTSG